MPDSQPALVIPSFSDLFELHSHELDPRIGAQDFAASDRRMNVSANMHLVSGAHFIKSYILDHIV
jgi:hypothetical protein